MEVREIKALIRKGESFVNDVPFRYELLSRLADSNSFTDGDWKSWLRASLEPIDGRLRHLDMALQLGLSASPDQRPVREQAKRELRADRIRKQLAALAESIGELEQDEGFTWRSVIWKFRGDACRSVAARYPTSEWRRSFPPMVRLGEGWEHGVEASLESMPTMLQALELAVDAWESQSPWPVRANQGETQCRACFVRIVSGAFERRYKKPLNKVVAALANEFFPELVPLDERTASRLAHG